MCLGISSPVMFVASQQNVHQEHFLVDFAWIERAGSEGSLEPETGPARGSSVILSRQHSSIFVSENQTQVF